MRVLLSLSLLISVGCCQFASAASGVGAKNPSIGTASADLDLKASTQLRLLELKYFEHTFDSQTAEERVERVERLVRGEASEGDPSDRVKSIAATLQADGESLAPFQPVDPPSNTGSNNPSRSSKGQTQAAGSDANSTNASGNANTSASNDRGSYPHVTNLEKEILRTTYEGDRLVDRLARLETKAFGKVTNSNDFSSRTDKLEDYAENVLHDRPFAINPDIDKTYIIPASRQSYSTAQRNNGPDLADEENALAHFFGSSRRPGTGMSFAPTAPVDTENAAPAEDPAVFQKTPPPAGTRMITQVGWCEVQIFGHTFPHMHLTQRLRQLNDEVLPKTTKLSDMQLMDDMDPIMTAVLSRKNGQQVISSGRSATH